MEQTLPPLFVVHRLFQTVSELALATVEEFIYFDPSNNQEDCRTAAIRIDVGVRHSTAAAGRRTGGAGGGISTAIPQSVPIGLALRHFLSLLRSPQLSGQHFS